MVYITVILMDPKFNVTNSSVLETIVQPILYFVLPPAVLYPALGRRSWILIGPPSAVQTEKYHLIFGVP